MLLEGGQADRDSNMYFPGHGNRCGWRGVRLTVTATCIDQGTAIGVAGGGSG